jgi:hypothetical protein
VETFLYGAVEVHKVLEMSRLSVLDSRLTDGSILEVIRSGCDLHPMKFNSTHL